MQAKKSTQSGLASCPRVNWHNFQFAYSFSKKGPQRLQTVCDGTVESKIWSHSVLSSNPFVHHAKGIHEGGGEGGRKPSIKVLHCRCTAHGHSNV